MSEIDLTSQEVKDAIASAIAEATEGLKAKNTELLGKLKKAQQGQQIDPADFAALEAERDDLKARLADTSKAAAKAQKDLDAATKRAADTEAAFHRSFADGQMTDALTKAGVTNPVHLKAAKALLGASVSVVVEGDSRVVKAGDKALVDFVAEWAGGDEGKHFVTAPETQGGGSQGGSRGGTPQNGSMGGDKAARLARAEAILRENNAV